MHSSTLDELILQGKALVHRDWRVTTAVAIVFPFIFTYLLTSLQSFVAARRQGESKEPPIAPYVTPFVGNLFSFAFDTQAFLDGLRSSFSRIPVRLRIAHERLFYISGADSVLTLFRSSRDLTTVPATVHVLEAGFGSPASSRPVYNRDDTGVFANPLPGSNPIAAHQRVHHLTHKSLHENLTGGTSLSELAARFMSNLEEELYELDIGSDEWTDIDDFYGMVQEVVFKASTSAMCGKHLFELNPDFTKNFWEFDNHMIRLFKKVPKWLTPRSYELRGKMLKSLEKWHRVAKEEFDWEDEEMTKTEYEEWYGSKMMRQRAKDYGAIQGLDAEALAAQDLGMIWGANANIVPIIGWSLIDSLFRPELLSRVRAEVNRCTTTTNSTHPTLHLPTLFSSPLLQSIYAEELRLRGSVMIQRVPVIDNFKIGPWKFPRGKMIVASSWHEHRDRSVWNESSGVSVEEFYAERFLTYGDDPSSGPRKPAEKKTTSEKTSVKEAEAERGEADKTPKFSIDPVLGSFIPYGGGQKMCPGRFYAKQEALGGLALFLRTFDINVGVGGEGEEGKGEEKWEEWKQDMPKMNMDYFAFGVIPPKGTVKARMRRRRGA